MALSIHLSTFVSGGYTGNKVRWDLHETNSGALVDSHEEIGPHGQVYNFGFTNGIQDIVYTVKFYDVPPGAPIGNLVKSHDITVSTSTIVLHDDIEIIVGHGGLYDPIQDDTATPAIPELVGKSYSVQQRNIGQLLQVREAEILKDTVNGGFQLLGGKIFNEDDIFIIKINPEYIVNPPGSTGAGGAYKSVELVITDKLMTGSDFGKLLIINGNQKVITATVPLIASIPEKIPLRIMNVADFVVNTNFVLQLQPGETIRGKNKFILSRAQDCEIIKLGAELYLTCNAEDAFRRGQLEIGYRSTINRVVADGTEYEQADLPGLVEALNDFLPGSVVTDFATWNLSVNLGTRTIYPNKMRFALYGTKVRVPDWMNQTIRFIKNVGGADAQRISNVMGGYQIHMFEEHTHALTSRAGGAGAGNLDGADEIMDADAALGGNTSYNLQGKTGVEPNVGRSGKKGGIETRSENGAQLPLIII